MPKQEALEELIGDYSNSFYFERFLQKMERKSESTLIKELFGSHDAYIDTAGDYYPTGVKQEMSIIEYEEANGYDVKAIWKWYCANFEKAWRWMFPKKP